MPLNQDGFILWLGGFSDAIDGAPTAAQWATVKTKLAAVDGADIAVRVSSASIPPPPAAGTPAPLPLTESEWLVAYREALLAARCPSDQAEWLSDNAVVDLDMDPVWAANNDFGVVTD